MSDAPVFICGGDPTPSPRANCPNTLHDHPLPRGYVDSHEAARIRIQDGWGQAKCRDCGLYGWKLPSRNPADV